MYSSDSSIEAAALACLESFIRTLYPNASDPPVGLAQEIIKQSLELLKEPEKTQATSATKMLAALLRASRESRLTMFDSLLMRSIYGYIRILAGTSIPLPPVQQSQSAFAAGSDAGRYLVIDSRREDCLRVTKYHSSASRREEPEPVPRKPGGCAARGLANRGFEERCYQRLRIDH